MEELRDYISLRRKALEEYPQVKTLWMKTALKRRLGSMFARMRIAREVSQKEIAERTNWDRGYVSRLEGVQGGLPCLNTFSRFANACDLTIGLVVCARLDPDGKARVIDALSLYPDPSSSEEAQEPDGPPNFFEGLVGQRLQLKD
jgi:transcriptional regulator with XRE-family HTH domain